MSFKEQIDKNNLPSHIAIIMDGNGRWAKKKGAMRIFGHHNAIQAVRDSSEAAAELGIKYLTLYAFSTENWNRPKDEVNALMELLVNTIAGETPTLMKNNIQLNVVGNVHDLPVSCQNSLSKAINETKNNTRLILTLALSYSGRWEIVDAAKKLAQMVSEGKLSVDDITEERFSTYLSSYPIPDPELMIRTSGELRISNFLIWQLAYTELYVIDTLWPDFRREHFYEAIFNYQKRERRFGKTSEQVLTEQVN
jgi:undecaprenyl diphosphate synthase